VARVSYTPDVRPFCFKVLWHCQSIEGNIKHWSESVPWPHPFFIHLYSYTAFTFKNHQTTTILRPFFRYHSGEPVPEENFWTLWCKGRLTEADTPTIRLGATPSGLTSVHFHHPPHIFYRLDALPAAQPTVSKHWRQLGMKKITTERKQACYVHKQQ